VCNPFPRTGEKIHRVGFLKIFWLGMTTEPKRVKDWNAMGTAQPEAGALFPGITAITSDPE
jgi:hypothetical protein